MLTADLVRARVQRGELVPRYLDPGDAEALDRAAKVIATWTAHVGRRREDLDSALSALVGEGTDFLLHRGLSKLVEDRSTFEVTSTVEPSELRRALFEESAKNFPPVRHPSALHPVTRDDIIARVAERFSITPEAAARSMYADLEDEQVLREVPPIAAEELLHRYNLGLAQSLLLRASGLTIEIAPGDPARYRQLFRWIKFFRLMHRVEGGSDTGYTVHLDGPMSLFQLSQKYGVQLAEFLPALLLCRDWVATAEVQWGPQKRRMTFRVRSDQGLVSHYPDKGVYLSREEEWLIERWAALETPWQLERRSELFDLDGKGVLIPDFCVRHPDGRIAWVEVMGFWKRDYLEARLALLKTSAPPNLVLAVPWRLRGSEDDLRDVPGTLLFYKDVIVAKELLDRVESVAIAAPKAEPEAGASPAGPRGGRRSPRRSRA